jgi:hypothetical protein
MNRSGFTLSRQMLLHCRFIELIRFTFFYSYGIPRTFAQTGSQSVTEVVGRQYCLAVDHFDGAFSAGWNAQPAAVTFILVDSYDFS